MIRPILILFVLLLGAGQATAQSYDEFVGKPDYAALFGDGFYNRAKFFEGVHAYATAGGNDTVVFTNGTKAYSSSGTDSVSPTSPFIKPLW